jgi:hypothetical protein
MIFQGAKTTITKLFERETCTFPYYSSLYNSHMDKATGANFELFVLHY